MGWSSGEELANDVWNVVKDNIPKNKRQEVSKKIIVLFERYDVDDWWNSEGVEGVAHPEWFEDE